MMDVIHYASPEQLAEHKRVIKQQILWCIFYREREFEQNANGGILASYMSTLMDRLWAMNSLFGYPAVILEILELLEAARRLYLYEVDEHCFSPSPNFLRFRKYILDARALVDKISIKDDGDA